MSRRLMAPPPPSIMSSVSNERREMHNITSNTILAGTFNIPLICNDNITQNLGDITQVVGNLTNNITYTNNLSLRSSGYISFADNVYRLLSDRIWVSNDALNFILYSDLLFCRGVTSNIQTQFNTITSNAIFQEHFLCQLLLTILQTLLM